MSFLTNTQTWETYHDAMHTAPEAWSQLQHNAADALAAKRFSVVDKPPPPPPGGSLHDYSSQAPYWWPDPAKPDGLPYIRRDGEINPEFYNSDRTTMTGMCNAVSSLIHYTWLDTSPERGRHARHAAHLLRMWFLDAQTRMNPNLRFAQRIPGLTDGRGIGIIDTIVLCFLIDEVVHFERMIDDPESKLRGEDIWPASDRAALRRWFSDYLDWLLTSDNGRDECKEFNNHGTWYDAQVVAFAIFCGRPETARNQIANFTRARIASQISPDGSQPHELARTLSQNYTTFNLIGFALLAHFDARLASSASDTHSGERLWRWRADNGAGILAALDWMLPYYLGERPWTHKQISPFDPAKATWLLNFATQETGDARYASAARKLATAPWNLVSFLGAGSDRH